MRNTRGNSSNSSGGFDIDDIISGHVTEEELQDIEKDSRRVVRDSSSLLEEEMKKAGVKKVKQKPIKDEVEDEEEKSVEEKEEGDLDDKETSSKKKKKKIKPIFIVLIVFLILAILGVSTFLVIKLKDNNSSKNKITGAEAVKSWSKEVGSLEVGDYLSQEISYANDVPAKEDFIKLVAKTISYDIGEHQDTTLTGKPKVDKNNTPVMVENEVTEDSEVAFTSVDYSEVKLKDEAIQELLKQNEVTFGMVGYVDKLSECFAQYMIFYEGGLPTKTENRKVNLGTNKKGYYVDEKEDIYIDNILYGSEDLHTLMDSFSEKVANLIGEESDNTEWKIWSELSEEDKEDEIEPEKTIKGIPITKEWSEWSAKEKEFLDENQKELDESKKKEEAVKGEDTESTEEVVDEDAIELEPELTESQVEELGEEPVKYSRKYYVSYEWCGAYYLQNNYKTYDSDGKLVSRKVEAKKGDGTLEDPAGLNTTVNTIVLKNEKNEEGENQVVEYDISVTLIDFKVSEDAIKWLIQKEERNRGIDKESELQYCVAILDIENLSDKDLTIPNKLSLSNEDKDLSTRTGKMFNITEEITLKPGESGELEFWSTSTELPKKYLIWGSDFGKKYEPVWFRVLAGSVEDETDDKGVYQIDRGTNADQAQQQQDEVEGNPSGEDLDGDGIPDNMLGNPYAE